jgi:mono/diheme cytochrome c family protein
MNLIAIFLFALALPAQQPDPAHGAHRHPEAEQVKNPVAASAESVANGGKLYRQYCAACHGKEGKGDGVGGAKLDPKPSNLTDTDWKHGQTDGEIFLVIHDGAKDTGMKSYGSRLTAHELWDLVNYVRSLKQ